jgi:hypothetical protein
MTLIVSLLLIWSCPPGRDDSASFLPVRKDNGDNLSTYSSDRLEACFSMLWSTRIFFKVVRIKEDGRSADKADAMLGLIGRCFVEIPLEALGIHFGMIWQCRSKV